jgi:hypothetical protein
VLGFACLREWQLCSVECGVGGWPGPGGESAAVRSAGYVPHMWLEDCKLGTRIMSHGLGFKWTENFRLAISARAPQVARLWIGLSEESRLRALVQLPCF